MAALKGKKMAGGDFQNDAKWIDVVYDFSVDSGTQADLEVFEATEDCVVMNFAACVETAVTSGGSAVMDLGVGVGGTHIWSNKAKASLGLGVAVGMDTFGPIKVASGSKMILGIEVADLTAGKIHFKFLLKRFS